MPHRRAEEVARTSWSLRWRGGPLLTSGTPSGEGLALAGCRAGASGARGHTPRRCERASGSVICSRRPGSQFSTAARWRSRRCAPFAAAWGSRMRRAGFGGPVTVGACGLISLAWGAPGVEPRAGRVAAVVVRPVHPGGVARLRGDRLPIMLCADAVNRDSNRIHATLGLRRRGRDRRGRARPNPEPEPALGTGSACADQQFANEEEMA